MIQHRLSHFPLRLEDLCDASHARQAWFHGSSYLTMLGADAVIWMRWHGRQAQRQAALCCQHFSGLTFHTHTALLTSAILPA